MPGTSIGSSGRVDYLASKKRTYDEMEKPAAVQYKKVSYAANSGGWLAKTKKKPSKPRRRDVDEGGPS